MFGHRHVTIVKMGGRFYGHVAFVVLGFVFVSNVLFSRRLVWLMHDGGRERMWYSCRGGLIPAVGIYAFTFMRDLW